MVMPNPRFLGGAQGQGYPQGGYGQGGYGMNNGFAPNYQRGNGFGGGYGYGNPGYGPRYNAQPPQMYGNINMNSVQMGSNGRPITPGLLACYHTSISHRSGGGYWLIGTGFDGRSKEKAFHTLDEFMQKCYSKLQNKQRGRFGRRGEEALWCTLGEYVVVLTSDVFIGIAEKEDGRPVMEREEIADDWFDSIAASGSVQVTQPAGAPAPRPALHVVPQQQPDDTADELPM